MPKHGYEEFCKRHGLKETWCGQCRKWEIFCSDCGKWIDHDSLYIKSHWMASHFEVFCPKGHKVGNKYTSY